MNDTPSNHALPPLSLSEADMLRAGQRTIERVVARLSRPDAGPVRGLHRTRDELDKEWREPPPEHGEDLTALVDRLAESALAVGMRSDHPRCFAFVPTAGTYPAVLADALAAAFLAVPSAWLVGAGPTQLELVTISWLCELLGLPPGSGGLFVSGGTEANLTALAVARDTRLGGDLRGARAYCSDQAHPSVAKALHILGFGRDQLVAVPADASLRLPVDVLAARIRQDRAGGLRPFLVIATAGTTGTGAVDPLPELAELCRAEGLWLHTDGAIGATARITERGRTLLAGLEASDSVTVDPHKWLFQPYDIGCVLLREPELLRGTFAMARHSVDVDAGYLSASQTPAPPASAAGADAGTGTGAAPTGPVNLSDYGVQLTRGLRALKLWLSLKTFGVRAFRDAVADGMRRAEYAAGRAAAHPELELTSPAGLCILTFRYRPAGLPRGPELDELQARVSQAVVAGGQAMVVPTRVRGEQVLRMCTINPRGTEADIDAAFDQVVAAGRELAARGRPAGADH
ncbi:pyridoxal-dependent decarboxylase [Allostreptomyces psammosilenae]|uniref:Glutamate/tyrosine decarboxylase-like PLP-dependent enzyme n=1 Tax=Allostreptomyces psammosilenae TaxID=1892865 RepID=A0A852ZYN4_9ACTN|nr:pyridoxal-dependent decarboxylase [Allostreptomyces psammosilenae]NYI07175.1 glutamate/tyrosine decarboxylase-like PLP-dependent enzyme [Allostreptomyces psammosilenae]